MEIKSVVPQLREAVAVGIDGHKHRLYYVFPQLRLQLVRDRTDLDELRRTYVRAVAEAEIQHYVRAMEVFIGHRTAVHVYQSEGPTESRLACGSHLGGHTILLLIPLHSIVAHHQSSNDSQKGHRTPSQRPSVTAASTAISSSSSSSSSAIVSLGLILWRTIGS